jgi:hypothetical protein
MMYNMLKNLQENCIPIIFTNRIDFPNYKKALLCIINVTVGKNET